MVCGITNKNMSNQESAKILHKAVIRKFDKRKVYSSLIDNIWSTDFADIQLASKLNKRIRFLLCITDILIN